MENRQQVVIVTGAGRGIGACVAQEFADKGAAVIVAERNEQDGMETAQAIVAAGGKALFVQTDVGKPDEIVRLMEKSVAAFGTIDVLINNAGVSRWKSPYELEVAEWDEIIETNLRSVFLCSR
ncbi:MAG: SDR family NAD(P)-dependent oxidoreductase, partial [Clostridia bacterium]